MCVCVCVCVCITESLGYTSVINTILYFNYIQLKKFLRNFKSKDFVINFLKQGSCNPSTVNVGAKSLFNT